MLLKELEKRDLPELFLMKNQTICTSREQWRIRREEIKQILCSRFCGYMPDFPLTVEGITVKEDENSYGGKAITSNIDIRIQSPFSYFSFPCTLTIPKNIHKPSVFLSLSFTPVIADGLGEEIIDDGFAIANVYYQDIAADKEDDFQSGAGRFCKRNRFDSWGKLGMWAWGAMRIMDYLQTLDCINPKKVAIVGHSRLGKTALWCASMDERFSLVAANDSGGAGAALFRGKTGETLENLSHKGSNCWFCQNLFQYVNKETDMPFDQHFLLSLIAPRHLYISSASEDEWADPRSEFLGCYAVNPVYKLYGEKGLVTKDAWPKVGTSFMEGRIGYHLRQGTHYFSRYDWQQIMSYRKKHNV